MSENLSTQEKIIILVLSPVWLPLLFILLMIVVMFVGVIILAFVWPLVALVMLLCGLWLEAIAVSIVGFLASCTIKF